MSNKNSNNNSPQNINDYKVHIQPNVDANTDSVMISMLGIHQSMRVQFGKNVCRYVELRWINDASRFIVEIILESGGKPIGRQEIACTLKPSYAFDRFFAACDKIMQ